MVEPAGRCNIPPTGRNPSVLGYAGLPRGRALSRTSRQKRMNSAVPKVLGSYFWGPLGALQSDGTLHQKLVRAGRLSRGPTPSRQL